MTGIYYLNSLPSYIDVQVIFEHGQKCTILEDAAERFTIANSDSLPNFNLAWICLKNVIMTVG